MILVLGGGISGLSVAYQLQKQNKDFLLIEEDSEVGGKIKSKKQDGFTIEKGPNTVLINNREIKELLDDLRLTDKIVKPDPIAIKNRFVLFENEIIPLPTSPLAAIKSPLLGWSTLIKILKEPFVSKTKTEESLAQFVRRRLGNQVYENFIYPFVTGIYAGDPEKMSINYTLKILKELESANGSIIMGLPSFMKAKKAKSDVDQLPKEKIFTFKNGLRELPISMAKCFEGKYCVSSKVISINKVNKGYEVLIKPDQGVEKTIKADKIISTIPFHNLKNCFDSKSFRNDMLSLNIDYVPAFVYHFGFNKSDIKIPQKSFGLLSREKETAAFLGVLFNSQFFPHTAKENHELITVITGGAKLRALKSLTEEDRRKRVFESLEKIFKIKGKAVFESSMSWTESIPQYNLGHQKHIDSIADFEAQNTGIYILGNYIDGISVSDCISNGINFVKKNFS